MKKAAKIAAMVLLAAGLLGAAPAEASNLDTYRNLLMEKKYTIKYVSVTPEERTRHKDSVTLTSLDSMQGGDTDVLRYKPLNGVIVSNGNARYEEVGYGGYANCRLQKYGRSVETPKATLLEKPVSKGRAWLGTIAGIASNFVGGYGGTALSALSDILLPDSHEVPSDLSFGSVDVTRLLNAMLPDEGKREESVSYRYVTEGWLPNGMNYVDYMAGDANDFEAIRYYFDGYTLVKIVSGQFWKDEDGEVFVRRNIVKITQFSPTPDEECLSLVDRIFGTDAAVPEEEEEEDDDE